LRYYTAMPFSAPVWPFFRDRQVETERLVKCPAGELLRSVVAMGDITTRHKINGILGFKICKQTVQF
jgi:hypothetical protein